MFRVEKEGHELQHYAVLSGGLIRTKGPGENWKNVRLEGMFPIGLYLRLLAIKNRETTADDEWIIPLRLPLEGSAVIILLSRAHKGGLSWIRLQYVEPADQKSTAFDIYLRYAEVDNWVEYINENMTC